jgi:hypothetical protein
MNFDVILRRPPSPLRPLNIFFLVSDGSLILGISEKPLGSLSHTHVLLYHVSR